MSEEIIIGYDIRALQSADACYWDENRKRDFLFRLDIENPFSTDTTVWTSLLENVPQNQFIGHQGLWNDLEAIETKFFQNNESYEMMGNIIAITLLRESCTLGQKQEWESMLPITKPSMRDTNWLFLGYDVSDMWRLSSLSNSGFLHDIEDVESMREKWGPKLNANHLFGEKQNVLEFKKFADERVNEHSPFFVFGLWLVKSVTQS